MRAVLGLHLTYVEGLLPLHLYRGKVLFNLHLTYVEELLLVFNYSQEFKQRYPGWTPPQDP